MLYSTNCIVALLVSNEKQDIWLFCWTIILALTNGERQERNPDSNAQRVRSPMNQFGCFAGAVHWLQL
jgi:hypothetical protein